MQNQSQNQKKSTATGFTVSYASLHSKRTHEHYLSGAKSLPAPRVAASARKDISMKVQLCQQWQRAAIMQQEWVDENAINLMRLPGAEEKHHLKILIRFAVLRQQEERSTHLSSVILRRTSPVPQQQPQRSQAAGAGSATGAGHVHKKRKSVTKAQAFDLNFVVKKLMEDIDIVYKRHGYMVTLKAFSELHPWQL